MVGHTRTYTYKYDRNDWKLIISIIYWYHSFITNQELIIILKFGRQPKKKERERGKRKKKKFSPTQLEAWFGSEIIASTIIGSVSYAFTLNWIEHLSKHRQWSIEQKINSNQSVLAFLVCFVLVCLFLLTFSSILFRDNFKLQSIKKRMPGSKNDCKY